MNIQAAKAIVLSGGSLNLWRSTAMQPVSEAEENCQSFIDGRDLVGRKLPEHSPDAALVDGPKVIDERKRPFREAAASGREWWIKETLTWGACNRYDADKREALVARDLRITDHHARPQAPLFMPNRGIQFDHD